MTKYNTEFKMKVVKEYLKGNKKNKNIFYCIYFSNLD